MVAAFGLLAALTALRAAYTFFRIAYLGYRALAAWLVAFVGLVRASCGRARRRT